MGYRICLTILQRERLYIKWLWRTISRYSLWYIAKWLVASRWWKNVKIIYKKRKKDFCQCFILCWDTRSSQMCRLPIIMPSSHVRMIIFTRYSIVYVNTNIKSCRCLQWDTQVRLCWALTFSFGCIEIKESKKI